MGFSVKVAPGVRVRASSRGVRTSLGPRVARVHLGAGRAGVSTGVGPVGYYTSIGGSRQRAVSTGAVNRQVAAVARRQAHADKIVEAQRLQEALDAVRALHRKHFAAAERPLAPPPPDPPVQRFRQLRRADARRRTKFFDFTGRRQAFLDADRRAQDDAVSARTQLAEQYAVEQSSLDASWAALLACDHEIVLGVLADAFADNEAAAAALGVANGEVSLLVVVPDESEIPERKPTVTQAGNLSLKKLNKTEKADLYKLLVFGHVLATLRETFAVVPSIESARIVAVRLVSPDAYGTTRLEAIAAARCSRAALADVQWDRAHAVQVFNQSCTETLVVQKGVTRALQPLPLDDEPELQALLESVELES